MNKYVHPVALQDKVWRKHKIGETCIDKNKILFISTDSIFIAY